MPSPKRRPPVSSEILREIERVAQECYDPNDAWCVIGSEAVSDLLIKRKIEHAHIASNWDVGMGGVKIDESHEYIVLLPSGWIIDPTIRQFIDAGKPSAEQKRIASGYPFNTAAPRVALIAPDDPFVERMGYESHLTGRPFKQHYPWMRVSYDEWLREQRRLRDAFQAMGLPTKDEFRHLPEDPSHNHKLAGNTRRYPAEDVRVDVRDIGASDRTPPMFRVHVFVATEHGSGRGTLFAFKHGDLWVVDDVDADPEHEGIGTLLYEAAAAEAAKRGGQLASSSRISEASVGFWLKQLRLGRAERRPPLRFAEDEDPDESDLFVLKPGVTDLANNAGTRSWLRPNGGAMSKVRASFEGHFDRADSVLQKLGFPALGTIELYEDELAGSDNGAGAERQFGYCADEKPIVIAFASKTDALPQRYIDGLMAHEFGHAIEYRYGRKDLERRMGRLPDSIERRADAIAKAIFGRTIEYGQNDIQCIGCGGKKMRPRRLG